MTNGRIGEKHEATAEDGWATLWKGIVAQAL